jgi:hypothetical protein
MINMVSLNHAQKVVIHLTIPIFSWLGIVFGMVEYAADTT